MQHCKRYSHVTSSHEALPSCAPDLKLRSGSKHVRIPAPPTAVVRKEKAGSQLEAPKLYLWDVAAMQQKNPGKKPATLG